MAITQSAPGVIIQEQDFSQIVPSVSLQVGALVGDFQWGPANVITQVGSESDLVSLFQKPVDRNAADWFVAKNFLDYAGNLQIIRAVDATSSIANSVSLTGTLTNTTTSATVAKVLVLNPDDFDTQRASLAAITGTQGGAANSKLTFIARFPGTYGNSISVSYADAAAFPTWAYNNFFQYPPAANSACFVVLQGSNVVEMYTVSLIQGTVDFNNQANFLDSVVNRRSNLIYVLSENLIQYNSGVPLPLSSGSSPIPVSGGVDNSSGAGLDSAKILAWNQFAAATDVDISYCMQGGDTTTAVCEAMVQDCAEIRKDCVGFLSPPASVVVGIATPTSGIATYFNTTLNISSSYAVADGNYKYQYDYYNNKYRWVPLNGDIAGLCAATAQNFAAWYSPAGLTRGQIKNVVKLAFNPGAAQQSTLYSAGVNNVISLPGEGYVLWGDKTLLQQPSAFSRINVRFLFIVLEKAIGAAARQLLFEMNNSFTQTRFIQMVEPFLRQVQGAQGIQRVNGQDGFYVVADSTINTPQVVDNNEFRGLIAIKPSRSINWITLTFAAVASSVDFAEFVGQYVQNA